MALRSNMTSRTHNHNEMRESTDETPRIKLLVRTILRNDCALSTWFNMGYFAKGVYLLFIEKLIEIPWNLSPIYTEMSVYLLGAPVFPTN